MQDKTVRVLVVDDQYVARSFFEVHVGMMRRYELAASLPSAEEAVAWCMENPVDLVIMDVVMKTGLDGLTCARSIKSSHPEIKIILTTSLAESRWIDRAKEAKIDSFWFKEYSEIPLFEVMERTLRGESVYPDSLPNQEFGRVRKYDLSERERDVLRELTQNSTNEEIGRDLGISPHTVKRHIESMLAKTGYKSRVDLAVNARVLGLVVHDDDLARIANPPAKMTGSETTGK